MEKFMLSLLFCSLEMSAVSLVYMGLLKALKNRQQPVLRYYSWVVILIGFLLPVKPSFGTPALTVSAPAVSYETAQPSYAVVEQSEPIINIYQVLFVIWSVGCFAYLSVYLYRYSSFRRSIRRLSLPANNSTLALAESTAEALGITKPVRVFIMREISSPMMTGLRAPVILLPDRHFDSTELRLIIKHELTHFKHKDLWIKLLTIICRAVHWFDPMMLFITRSIEQECEHYCDHSVTAHENTENKKLYCQSILSTVSAHDKCRKCRLRPVMATNFYTPKQGLKHRLTLILSSKRKKRFAFIAITAILLTTVSGSAIAFANTADDKAHFEAPVAVPENFAVTTTAIYTTKNTAEAATPVDTAVNKKLTVTRAPEGTASEPVKTYAVTTRRSVGLEGDAVRETRQDTNPAITTVTYVTSPAERETVVTTIPA